MSILWTQRAGAWCVISRGERKFPQAACRYLPARALIGHATRHDLKHFVGRRPLQRNSEAATAALKGERARQAQPSLADAKTPSAQTPGVFSKQSIGLSNGSPITDNGDCVCELVHR